MLLCQPANLIGETVFSADGHALGTVKAVADISRKRTEINVWIQTGPNVNDGRHVPFADLSLKNGRLTLKNHYHLWPSGMPIYV